MINLMATSGPNGNEIDEKTNRSTANQTICQANMGE
jgi:hypothetical protein